MSQLILLRHGQSMWNMDNRFTGWVDVPLSGKGVEEALQAGREIADQPIDMIFTSTLVRAQQTAMLAMSQHRSKKVPIMQHPTGQMAERTKIYASDAEDNSIPVFTDWHLNERYYGELQGANKQQTRDKYGDEQVHIWRRSFDVPPPAGESLAMTCERTIPYFTQHIVPTLADGQSILVAAHGNSLRSIVMHLENLSPEQVLQLEIATGVPRIYKYSNSDFVLIKNNT